MISPELADPDARVALTSAFGDAIDTAISAWVEHGAPDRAGPATFFEHPRWGTIVVLVEPSARMTLAAVQTANRRRRAAQKPTAVEPTAALELPPPSEMREILRQGMEDADALGLTNDAKHLHALGHLRQVVAKRLANGGTAP